MTLLRTIVTLLAPALLGSCIGSTTVNAYIGERSFDEDDFDDEATYGVEAVFDVLPFGLGIETGYMTSDPDGETDVGSFDLDGESDELYAGVRKAFREGENLRPYVGGGFAYTDTDLDIGALADSDEDVSIYLHVGVEYHFPLLIHVGVDYRVLIGAEGDFAGVDTDLDYNQISVFAGVSF